MLKRGREKPEPTAISVLPPETLTQILEALDPRSLGRAAQACRLWRALAYPIARPPRFRDPGFARFATDDLKVFFIATHDGAFIGITAGRFTSWNARGVPGPSPVDWTKPWYLQCQTYEDAVLARVSFTDSEGAIVKIRETRSAILHLAHSVEIREGVVRVSDPDREIVAEIPGSMFAVLDETIAVADEKGRLSFWSCPKK